MGLFRPDPIGAEYLAATLDMEGTVGFYHPKRGGPLTQIAAVHNCEWALIAAIGNALLEHWIFPEIGESGNQKRNSKHNRCWRLRVSKRRDICRYLDLVMPYMRSEKKIKKAREIQAYIHRDRG